MNPDFSKPVSYWERSTFFQKKDLIVVGAGLVGLSAALAYKKARPAEQVLVVDREVFPCGASSRNAGFACFGSMTELLADEQRMGTQAMLALVAKRWSGLQRLRAVIGDENMDYLSCGGYEVFTGKQKQPFELAKAEMSRLNQLLQGIVGDTDTFSLVDNAAALGLKTEVSVIANKLEGQLDPGKLMSHLLKLNQEHGVEIYRGWNLKSWTEGNQQISLHFDSPQIEMESRQLLIATNGFTNRIFPELKVQPARNQIFVSTPMPTLKMVGTFHAEEGYIYFRNVDNRLLMGGGRHWDLSEAETDKYDQNEQIIEKLRAYAEELIEIDNQKIEIAEQWSGILGVGKSKSPILERQSDRLVTAVRMGGMGVAIGLGVGQEAAEILLS